MLFDAVLLLKPDGVVSVEFPHLANLIREVQFDTIYHEHYCYLSLLAVERIFAAHGLKVFDVEQLPTHGGSLRVLACRSTSTKHPEQAGLQRVRGEEAAMGFDTIEAYQGFEPKVREVREQLLRFLRDAKEKGYAVLGELPHREFVIAATCGQFLNTSIGEVHN